MKTVHLLVYCRFFSKRYVTISILFNFYVKKKDTFTLLLFFWATNFSRYDKLKLFPDFSTIIMSRVSEWVSVWIVFSLAVYVTKSTYQLPLCNSVTNNSVRIFIEILLKPLTSMKFFIWGFLGTMSILDLSTLFLFELRRKSVFKMRFPSFLSWVQLEF